LRHGGKVGDDVDASSDASLQFSEGFVVCEKTVPLKPGLSDRIGNKSVERSMGAVWYKAAPFVIFVLDPLRNPFAMIYLSDSRR
jgi:hypothetical protein